MRLLFKIATLGLAIAACGRSKTNDPSPSPSASTLTKSSGAPAASSAASPAGSAQTPPAGDAPPVATFVPAKTTKECRALSYDMAQYQPRGELSLAGREGGVAAVWLVVLGGHKEVQLAFAGYDAEARQIASPRGVGLTEHPGRIFGTGGEWTVTWFDATSLAFARPKNPAIPAPDVQHLPSINPSAADDVALAPAQGGSMIAAAPFGSDNQLGLFLFAPTDPSKPQITALGVTHHAKAPHRPAVANDATGTYLLWLEEGGRIASTRFDAAGKEVETGCEIAPVAKEPRERLSIVPTTSGALATWVEGDSIKSRALDTKGCGASPIWTVAKGKWAQLVPTSGAALVAWVGPDGRLLAAKLGANGAPPAQGIDVAEGTAGVKDPPGAAVMATRTAFAWTEAMSPIVSSKRLVLRTLESACIPN